MTSPTPSPRILIAVIAYNESDSILGTLTDLAENTKHDVVVIDNASSDRTVDMCRSRGFNAVRHCVNTGGSMGTVATYFNYAHFHNYDILCQFDGDGQHLANELPKIIEPIRSGRADYVIGSRFIDKRGFQSSTLRRVGIRMFSGIISCILRQRITDSTSGFRAYNHRVIELFTKRIQTELNDVNELVLLAHFNGMRIAEVPVVMAERTGGTSEFHFRNALLFPLKGIINVLGCWLQKG